MYEKYSVLQAFSKSRFIFLKNMGFGKKIVILRVWEKRGNRHTHTPTLALMVWRVGGGGRERVCFEGLDEERGGRWEDRINRL